MSNQSDTLKMQVLTLVLFMWKNCKFSELSSNHSEDLNEKMHLINGEEQMAHLWIPNSIRYLLKISNIEFKKQVACFFLGGQYKG